MWSTQDLLQQSISNLSSFPKKKTMAANIILKLIMGAVIAGFTPPAFVSLLP